MKLAKVTADLWSCKSKSGTRYCLKRGEIGICNNGTCLRLEAIDGQIKSVIACFVTSSDGHGCERRFSIDNKIWRAEDAIIAAEQIIEAYENC